eukprot:CAMPEP_0181212070 /NCGR_PEP_ID=MMETSP1096-20121128/24146_1 /TAXON_ID=156174 ORGANISM="Chrysochromulina ericina, Strain CCMP281" /NCGR_SAMPLE_ID=MMETSP1096 /ASSEMBLY_ACC=CAM_ASM_000453 /LENGTH=127 /DNA_ID=CAMNT_0023303559 /DNA_START=1066 /DNA_END=1451 /DNA_ORIENTATION=+
MKRTILVGASQPASDARWGDAHFSLEAEPPVLVSHFSVEFAREDENAVQENKDLKKEVAPCPSPGGRRQEIDGVDQLEVEVLPQQISDELDGLIVNQSVHPKGSETTELHRVTVHQLMQEVTLDEQT